MPVMATANTTRTGHESGNSAKGDPIGRIPRPDRILDGVCIDSGGQNRAREHSGQDIVTIPTLLVTVSAPVIVPICYR